MFLQAHWVIWHKTVLSIWVVVVGMKHILVIRFLQECVCELLFISGLLHLELCCLQINVLSHWLITSTLHYIPLRHKMPGYEGIE
jgi:hypothetical protein